MKKVLFIDRDGSIIVEPKHDFQVDSFEKLEFLPRAISSLQKISELSDYTLAMVTNQDGLGTDSFPEDTFWPVHNKMLLILENEGIQFSDIVIDRTFAHENQPTRKPGTALLQHYLDSSYDLANSYVIGDRITDIELAKNLHCKAIFINHDNIEIPQPLLPYCALITQSWVEISEYLLFPPRKASVIRKTNETNIEIELDIDGSGKSDIKTGLGFFDHMLEQLARHSNCDMKIHVQGDLHIDEHHTIEDTAIALGDAFLKALGNKQQVERYGFLLPMDESLAQVAIDFSGRPWLVWNVRFNREMVGDLPTEMIMHFFKSFSDASRCNLNVSVEGENEHHKIEAIFKATAKAIKMAVKRHAENKGLPSTKGIL